MTDYEGVPTLFTGQPLPNGIDYSTPAPKNLRAVALANQLCATDPVPVKASGPFGDIKLSKADAEAITAMVSKPETASALFQSLTEAQRTNPYIILAAVVADPRAIGFTHKIPDRFFEKYPTVFDIKFPFFKNSEAFVFMAANEIMLSPFDSAKPKEEKLNILLDNCPAIGDQTKAKWRKHFSSLENFPDFINNPASICYASEMFKSDVTLMKCAATAIVAEAAKNPDYRMPNALALLLAGSTLDKAGKDQVAHAFKDAVRAANNPAGIADEQTVGSRIQADTISNAGRLLGVEARKLNGGKEY